MQSDPKIPPLCQNGSLVRASSEGLVLGNGTVIKTILVTGGCGFIGSHMVIMLCKNYPSLNVINLDRLDYCACLENVREVAAFPNYKFVKGDILSVDLVNYILKFHRVDCVMHFAAQTHVDNSFGNSLNFTETNITGTHVLLESCRLHKIKRFIHVSTDEVYGETKELENVETTASLTPTNPYSASKAGGELLVQSYIKSFGLPAIITRGNNVYGPHQYPEKMIPKFICLLEEGKPCCIHGNGENRRCFMYVSDAIRAFLIILLHGGLGEIYNIGTQFEISTKKAAEYLIRQYGYVEPQNDTQVNPYYIQYVEDRTFNDCRYRICNRKIKALGWEPLVSWEEGIATTIEWYKKHRFRFQGLEQALEPHPREGRRSDFGLYCV
eukprot:Sdes_comp20716_c0_seq1m16418